MFNLVVTLRGQQSFGRAIELLRPLGRVGRTPYFNVLTLEAADPRAALERISAQALDVPEVREALAHVTPLSRIFSFSAADEFDLRAKEILVDFVPRLEGRSFHVRFHRRGFKDRINSQQEEQALDGFLLAELERRGSAGRIDFDDPDAILVIESVGNTAGISLWTREELRSFPLVAAN